MDDPKNTLIGMHGYCTQELVNLLLVGKAVSNVHDEDRSLDGLVLKGIPKQSEIGYLTTLEKYNTYIVGNKLKNPIYPIWVLYMESHFTVLFQLEQNNKDKIFDVHYYDELGNQQEEYKITVDITGENEKDSDEDDDLTPPLEDCIQSKWPNAYCNWNGSDPLL